VPSSRVRQAAFYCAQVVIRTAPKQAMNGYIALVLSQSVCSSRIAFLGSQCCWG
jgi:hypothetical protein